MDRTVTDVSEPGADVRSGSAGAAVVETKTVNLALQGGGAHGAFTWGVLDRLLEDGRLAFEGISGTSAGAINGAMLAQGMATGGRERARDLLEQLWLRIARSALWSPFQPTWLDRLTGNPNLDYSPFYFGFDLMMRLVSPYQFNPMGLNPLRDILEHLLDLEALRSSRQPRLYVSATHVTEGRLRVFSGDELSVDALIASTCLPFLFQAVEIDGEYYWDGGYMGNPTIYPLIHACAAPDVVVVQINPIRRDSVPRTPSAIIDRMNEISFNSAFMREVRAMELINRLLRSHQLDERECGLRPMYLHLIGDEERMQDYTVSSKLNADWGFIRTLRDLGRDAASRWLDRHFADLGRDSTFEIGSMFV